MSIAVVAEYFFSEVVDSGIAQALNERAVLTEIFNAKKKSRSAAA
jgi:hypothetical protein